MNDPLPPSDEEPGADEPQQPAEIDTSPQLLARRQSGANWFFWISALSVVNAVVILTGGNDRFVIGLGIANVIADIGAAIAQNNDPQVATIVHVVSFVLCLGIAGMFAGFGALAKKGHLWAFVVGMLLYGGDGLLLVAINLLLLPEGDWMSVGFHAFALFCMFSGLKAAIALKAAEAPPANPYSQAV